MSQNNTNSILSYLSHHRNDNNWLAGISTLMEQDAQTDKVTRSIAMEEQGMIDSLDG